MSKLDDGGPAFPHDADSCDDCGARQEGMSLRQYAAIHLKQPDSGIDWLDEMIRGGQLAPAHKAGDAEAVEHRWRVCPQCKKWKPMPVAGIRPTDKRMHLRCPCCGHRWYSKLHDTETTASKRGNEKNRLEKENTDD